ncbi:MAG: tetratricopeptide repeat protein [Bacteroidales bacterium]|nr:tetratricopeptide repeat protein [Bacteroidales bacterium]
MALKLGEKYKDQVVIGKSYSYIGVTWFYQAEYDSAEKYYLKALDYLSKADDDSDLGIVLNNLGVMHKRRCNYNQALNYYNQALKLHDENHDTLQIGGTLMNIGVLYFTMDRYEKALDNYLRALEMFRKINNASKIAGAYANLGELYELMGEPEVAFNYFKQAIEIQISENDLYGMANSYLNLGVSYKNRNELDSAIDCLNKARNTYYNMEDKEALAFTAGYLSETYHLMGRDKEALEEQMNAVNLNKQIQDNYLNVGYSFLGLTELLVSNNKYDKAASYRDSAMMYAIKVNGKDLLARLYFLSARIDSALNRPYNALSDMMMYASYHDSVYNEENLKKLADMRTKYETETIEKENEYLKIEQGFLKEKRRKEKVIFGSILFIIIIITVFILFIYRSVKNKKQQQALYKVVLETENVERKKMAEEIHDGLGPLLSAVKIYVSETQAVDDEENNNIHKTAIDLVDQSIQTARSVSHRLMPAEIINCNLDGALKKFIDMLNSSGKISVHLDVRGQFELSVIQNEMLYRVVCELINNTLKHAGAKNIKIEMGINKKKIFNLTYIDDGQGFDILAKSESTGLGLNNIKNRIESLNGVVEYESQVGKGVKVYINLPVMTLN